MIRFLMNLIRPQPRVPSHIIRDVIARNTATHDDRRQWMGF